MSLEEIATYITDDLNTFLVEDMKVQWKCDCSKERMEEAIASLGKSDIEELAKDENVEVVCHFCNSKYNFSKEDILKLIK